jgi:Ca-activated chloride channel homolog
VEVRKVLKKRIHFMTGFGFLLFCLSVFTVHAAEPLISSSRMEGVLVVDVSNSMLTSDPNKISNEAMKMFIDMSSLKGDKIGVISYAGDLVSKADLVKLQTEEDKSTLKGFIDSLGRFPNTDIATGLSEAISTLDNGHEPDYLPLIVLLADGNIDVNEETGKTDQQAAQALDTAVADAKAKGYPIYVIGLNADGTLNKEVLQNVSSSTNGKFFETSDANDLPGILSEIFANHLKLKVVPVDEVVGNGEFQDISINIPNTNVLEANLSLVSSEPLEVKLVDPSGMELPLPSENIQLNTSKSYTMIKMIDPPPGDWILKVKGVPNNKIDINFVFNYDLQLTFAPLANQNYQPGDSVKVTAYFEDNGTKVTNLDLYQNMNPILYVKDTLKGDTEEIPLTSGESGFTGEFIVGDSEQYELVIKAESSSFYRETSAQKIRVQLPAAPPAETKESPIENKESESFSWVTAALIVMAAILLVLPVYAFSKRRRKKSVQLTASSGFSILPEKKKQGRGFSGLVVVEIRNEETGEILEPQAEKLKAFKGEFSLRQLFKLGEEFSEIDPITFVPLTDQALLLFNKSACQLEMNGEAIDEHEYYRFRPNDNLRISLRGTKVSMHIYITSLEKAKQVIPNRKHA